MLKWRTVYGCAIGLFWYSFIEGSNEVNKYQNKPRVIAYRVCHNITYVILLVTRHDDPKKFLDMINSYMTIENTVFTYRHRAAFDLFILVMTSQLNVQRRWRNQNWLVARTWKVVFISLYIDFINGDIMAGCGRISCKQVLQDLRVDLMVCTKLDKYDALSREITYKLLLV